MSNVLKLAYKLYSDECVEKCYGQVGYTYFVEVDEWCDSTKYIKKAVIQLREKKLERVMKKTVIVGVSKGLNE